MNVEEYIQSAEYTQITVLRRLRILGGIKTVDAALALHMTQPMLALLETGRREATQELIEAYSRYLEEALHLKNRNLYAVLTALAGKYKVTDGEARQHPVDWLYVYLKACCEGGGADV